MVKMVNARKNVVFQLINCEQNEALLKKVPHRRFCDLAVIYRIVVEKNKLGVTSTVVSQNLAEGLGLCEGELFDLAKENSKRLFPPVVEELKTTIMRYFDSMGLGSELCKEMLEEMYNKVPMYIVTNSENVNGAAAILYDGIFEELAEKFDGDLYILPSSIHEVIVLPVIFENPEDLSRMVTEINQGHVMPAERLSNQVYLYDRKKKKFSEAR